MLSRNSRSGSGSNKYRGLFWLGAIWLVRRSLREPVGTTGGTVGSVDRGIESRIGHTTIGRFEINISDANRRALLKPEICRLTATTRMLKPHPNASASDSAA